MLNHSIFLVNFSKKILSYKCINKIRFFQSDEDDCEYPDWYHQKCFFQTHLPRTEAAFDGYTNLRYADQLAIRVQLGTFFLNTNVHLRLILFIENLLSL